MLIDDLTKECKSCIPAPRILPLTMFSKRSASPDGRASMCKDCESRKHKEYYRSKKSKRIHRTSKLKLNYGLTPKEYDLMYIAQGGACAICLEKYEKLVVDHDHATNQVRALLCPACNHGLGRFRDNIEIMKRAVQYLEVHSAERSSQPS